MSCLTRSLVPLTAVGITPSSEISVLIRSLSVRLAPVPKATIMPPAPRSFALTVGGAVMGCRFPEYSAVNKGLQIDVFQAQGVASVLPHAATDQTLALGLVRSNFQRLPFRSPA